MEEVNKSTELDDTGKKLNISDVIHSDSQRMGIDAQWEITKALREECRKSYGEPMGIDAEEEIMKELRRMS
jgi:hypothetical protein